MSLSKMCFLATLVVVVAFACVRRVDVARTPNSRPYHQALAPDESPWYTGLASELVRSTGYYARNAKPPRTLFFWCNQATPTM
jgi:hypothetical protein